MIKLLHMEYYRLFKNKGFYLVLGINGLLVLGHILFDVLPYADNMSAQMGYYPLSAYEKWMGGDLSSAISSIYFMFCPLIAALPYGGTLQADLNSGYLRQICIRKNKNQYYLVKLVVSFTSGALMIIPLVLDFFITCLCLPLIMPQSGLGIYSIYADSFLGSLFFQHPMIYLSIYLGIDFVFMGILATLSMLSFLLTHYVYVAVLIPFLVSLLLFGASSITSLRAIAPMNFLDPSQIVPECAMVYIAIGSIIILMDLLGIFLWKKRELLF